MIKLKSNKLLRLGIYTSAFLFSFLILFSTKAANVSLILFYCFCLCSYLYFGPHIPKKRFLVLTGSTLLLLFSIIISFISLSDLDLILKATGRRITFLLTPIALLLLTITDLRYVKEFALKGIVWGGLLSSVFLLTNILHEYYLTRPFLFIDSELFNYYHTNQYFTRILDIHPSYFGIYLITGLTIIYFGNEFRSRTIPSLFFLFSTTAILFLNARIILGLFFLLNTCFLIRFFFKKTGSVKATICATLILFLVSCSILYVLTKNTYVYQRVFKQTLWELTYEVGTNYSYSRVGDSRVARWMAARNIISEKPFLGYGVFNETEALIKEYKRMNMQSSVQNEYNSHNQFIGFAVEGGILSAIALIVFFSINFFVSIRRRNLIYFFIIFSVFSICLFENYLIRNAGIIFTSFYVNLFLFYEYRISQNLYLY